MATKPETHNNKTRKNIFDKQPIEGAVNPNSKKLSSINEVEESLDLTSDNVLHFTFSANNSSEVSQCLSFSDKNPSSAEKRTQKPIFDAFITINKNIFDKAKKTSLLAELQTNGIKISNNKFSSIDKSKDIQDLVNTLRINQGKNQIATYEKKDPESVQIKIEDQRVKKKIFEINEEKPKTTIKPYQRVKKKIFEEKPETTIEPSFFSTISNFLTKLDPFSCCRGK